jgi:hypothetical protein
MGEIDDSGELDDSGVLDVSGELDDSGELDNSGVLDVSGEPDVGESISSSSRPIAANSLLAVSSEAAKLSWCDWDL